MNKQMLHLLKEVKTEMDTYLDLSIGHDDPKHIMNQIQLNCNHPIYYLCGFYKVPNVFKDETEAIETTEFNCDYALLRCLECGDFIAIDKLGHLHPDWYCYHNGKKIHVMQRKQSYEEVRQQYIHYCISSHKNEVQTVNNFQKLYFKNHQVDLS